MPLPVRFGSEIEAYAASYFLNPLLVSALIAQESGYHPRAYRYEQGFWDRYMKDNPAYRGVDPDRYSASYGLMQVLYVVAVEVGFSYGDPEYLFVPSINLQCGCRKLQQLMDWAGGRTAQALAAYNGGRGGNSAPPYRNQAYADAVLRRMGTNGHPGGSPGGQPPLVA